MRLFFSTATISLFLWFTAIPAWALDPPVVKGHLLYGGQRYELRHAQALQNPDNPKHLWILLTTAELSLKDAADPIRTHHLAMSGKLRGVRLAVDAAAPNPNHLQGALLLSKAESPSGEIVFAAGAEKYWERLSVTQQRIVGKVSYAVKASTFSDTPAWVLDVEFSAPVFKGK